MSGRLGYLGFRIASALFGALPESAMRRLGILGGKLWWRFAGEKRDVVRRNLARVVGEAEATPRRVREMFASYGRYWAELFWVRERRHTELRANYDVRHEERILEASAKGRGVIVALPHMGNWEIAGLAAIDLGVPMLAAAEALPNQRIVDWFIETRGALGIEIVIVGRDRAATSRLLGRLRDGGAIALLADRDLSGRGIEVEFFGERTTMPAGPAALADRTGAALLPVGCFFREGRGHTFEVGSPIVIPDLPDKADRLAVATQAFAHALEGLIRKAPEQWHLFQPNWPSDSDQA